MLRAHAAAYLAWRGDQASLIERRVLALLTACRTAALGGHAWECDSCGQVRAAYNSCLNRHCPTCRGEARAKWLDGVREHLLPVPYFHVVFAPPHELCLLMLANRAVLWGLLFRAAAATLLELAADPHRLGGRIGILMVLHTWGQLMDLHPHLHCVIPGGGLSLDGTRWVSCREFFLPVQVISALFRGKYLAGLKRLWRDGKLKLGGKLSPLANQRQFESWLSTLYKKEWVVYVQGPPAGIEGAEAVLKYLARYVSGVAISDRRLASHAGGRVTFRCKNYARGGQSEPRSLPGVEFVRRYLLHVLPRGFVRIRSYGLLSNRHRARELARCRALLGAAPSASPEQAEATAVLKTPDAQSCAAPDPTVCPRCGRGRLQLLEYLPQPSCWQLVARLQAASSAVRPLGGPGPGPRPRSSPIPDTS